MGCGKSKPKGDALDGLEVSTEHSNSRIEFEHKFKLLLIGNSSVGKSSLLMRFADRSFPTEYMNTIGIDYKTHTIEVNDQTVKLQMWDTAGQERFRTITSSYYRGAHGILLVFDLTDIRSFEDVAGWLEEIRAYAVSKVNIVLVGNKCDMSHARKVTAEEARAFAEQNGVVYKETSALSGEHVDQTFHELAETLLQSQFAKQANPM